jgi:hypothetical protein
MTALTWVHIAAGLIALASGTLAATVRKGGALHARAGTWFFASMLVLGVTASILGWLEDEPDSGIGGLFTIYFVVTSWVAARSRDGTTGKFELLACGVAIGAAVAIGWSGFTGGTTPAGPGPLFALASICLIAGALDLRAVLLRKLSPAQRISRHLWRMCFAFFIATGSFFLGQQDVMPPAVRGSPILFVLAFAPFALMLVWLVRVRFSRMLSRLRLADAG